MYIRTVNKPVLVLMHVWACHVSNSEGGGLENVEVAIHLHVFEACCMTQIMTETDSEALPKCCVRSCVPGQPGDI